MAKQRMAGERLSQEEQNRRARENRANNPEQLQALMGKVDRDKFDFSGYDDKQIAMAFQGDKFDKEDYARLTGDSGSTSDPDPQPETDAEIGPGTETGGTQEQEAEDLMGEYVNGIINQGGGGNTATNTGDINVTGSNYGSANTGVIDYSVNIAGGDKGLGSFGAAAAANALNENQYERSRSKLTGTGQAAKYSAMAEDLVGSKDRVKGLDTQTDNVSNYYRDLAKKQNVMAFGDYMSP